MSFEESGPPPITEPSMERKAGLGDFKFPIALTILAVLAVIGLALTSGDHRQGGVMGIMVVVILWHVLNLGWLVFAWKVEMRLKAMVLVLGMIPLLLCGALFKLEGFSGDFVPVFTLRIGNGEMATVTIEEGSKEVADDSVPGGGDFLQFLGNERDIRVRDVDLNPDWKSNPPEAMWRREVGAAWSGFAVKGELAITMEQRKADESIIAYHLLTGEPIWEHHYAARYDNPIGGVGPRTTPTIDGGDVYCFGGTGVLTASDLITGEQHWQVDVMNQLGAVLPEWGFASSPLVHEGKVIVSTGAANERSLVAFDRTTGTQVWTAGSDPAAWSTPVLATVAGRQVILMVTKTLLTAHDPETGEAVWTYPWDNRNRPNVAVPLVYQGDKVFLSSGYTKGAELIQVTESETGDFRASRVWKSLSMKAKFSNLALIGDHVMGLDDGIFASVKVDTGERVWKDGRYGHGQILVVGDHLLVTDEGGEVVLLKADPAEWTELASMDVFDHKTWNPPCLAGRYLVVRTHKEAACYKLPITGQ